MMNKQVPILEYDADETAVIDPQNVLPTIDIPEHCVFCFFQDVITSLDEAGKLRKVYKLQSETGPNWVYEMNVNGQRMALLHPGVGAPMAAAFMEEVISLGCRKFIACGGCGVIDKQIGFEHVVVPETAVRDEGTSYHYLPPSREVSASLAAVSAICQTLETHHIQYVLGKTWTTDAVYRETSAKVARRRAEGCLVVEMETAAFCAVAQFRKVTFGQILYGGDDLTGEKWDSRNWQNQTSTREKLFWLAAEASLQL